VFVLPCRNSGARAYLARRVQDLKTACQMREWLGPEALGVPAQATLLPQGPNMLPIATHVGDACGPAGTLCGFIDEPVGSNGGAVSTNIATAGPWLVAGREAGNKYPGLPGPSATREDQSTSTARGGAIECALGC
jgi:hypothetical protein